MQDNMLVTILLLVWSLGWKGLALWYAAKRDEKWWFIAFMVINTVGILEILYLVFKVKSITVIKKGNLLKSFRKKHS